MINFIPVTDSVRLRLLSNKKSFMLEFDIYIVKLTTTFVTRKSGIVREIKITTSPCTLHCSIWGAQSSYGLNKRGYFDQGHYFQHLLSFTSQLDRLNWYMQYIVAVTALLQKPSKYTPPAIRYMSLTRKAILNRYTMQGLLETICNVS